MSFFMNNNFTYIVILKPFYKKFPSCGRGLSTKGFPLQPYIYTSNCPIPTRHTPQSVFFLRVAHTNSLHKDIRIFYVDGVMVILCPHFSIASTTTNDNVNLSIYGSTPIHTLRSCNCTRREVSWHDWSL